MPSMAGSYGRKEPSGMTRLFVNGTKPPAPSGTVPSESPQKKKKHNGVGMASMAVIVTGASRRGWAKAGIAARAKASMIGALIFSPSVTDFSSGVDSYEALLFEHLVHSICITYPLLHAMLGTIERESYYRHAIAVLLWIVDTRSAFALLGGLGVLSLVGTIP
jgi:hypothetical protein